MAEIIALQFRYRLLFEPEHEFQTKKGHLLCDKYMSEDIVSLSQEGYLTRVFKNRVDSDWIGQISNRKYKMHLWPYLPKKYIVKFVRCNLGAHFINDYYNIPVFFIIRNPHDVILSQNRVKFDWLYKLDHFKTQNKIGQVLKEKYSFDWEELKHFSDIEILTLRWCIENRVVFDLNPKHKPNFKILNYEALKADINLFYDLCTTFKIEPLSNIEEVYSRPSSKTHPKSTIRNQSAKTHRKDDKALSEINGILNRFKVTV